MLWCSVPCVMTQDVVEIPWFAGVLHTAEGERRKSGPGPIVNNHFWLSAWSAQSSLPLSPVPRFGPRSTFATHLEAILLAIVLITYRFFPEWSGSHVRRPCFSPGSRLETNLKPDPPGLRRTSSRAKPAQIPNGNVEANRIRQIRNAPIGPFSQEQPQSFLSRDLEIPKAGVSGKVPWADQDEISRCESRDRLIGERRSPAPRTSGPP